MENRNLQLLFISDENCNEDFLLNSYVYNRFTELYAESFPRDSDESEDLCHIINRVKGELNDYEPDSYLLIAIDKKNNVVVGGMVLEYYKRSKCLHLTYLFVDAKIRSNGVGTKIVKEGLPHCIQKIKEKKQKSEKNLIIQAIFFETENPALTEITGNNVEEKKRLKKRISFFKKNNAKWIDIPYVQPCFPGKKRVYNLFLMVFPEFTGLRLDINKRVIIAFLKDLYNSLEYGINSIPFDSNDSDFKRMELVMNIDDIIEEIDPILKLDTEDSQSLFKYKQELKNQHELLSKNEMKKYDGNLLDFQTKIDEICKKGRSEGKIREDGDFYLREVPDFNKSPKFLFGKVGIGLHFIEKAQNNNLESYTNSRIPFFNFFNKNHNNQTADYTLEYCPIFSSYERDLLSQRFHMNPPYHSRCEMNYCDIEAIFPTHYQFTSEGRLETFYLENLEGNYNNYSKKLRVFLNKMAFRNSNHIIWELVLTNTNEQSLNEYEIIQFIKYYTGGQEKYLPLIQFVSEQGEGTLEIKDLLQNLFKKNGLKNEKKEYQIIAGTIQIDTGNSYNFGTNIPNIKSYSNKSIIEQIESISREQYFNIKNDIGEDQAYNELWKCLYRYTRMSHQRDEINGHSFEDILNEKSGIVIIKEMYEVFCGFCIGIFDFERMEYEEILDTLNPRLESATNSQMLIMNRNALICFCHNDSLFSESWEKIGLSPYLLIPNSVVAHNVFLIEQTEKLITSAISSNKSNKQLLEYKDKIDQDLNSKLLPNVFQYVTEQDLYSYGQKHRGVDALLIEIKEKSRELQNKIDNNFNVRRSLFEKITTLILGIVSLIQIFEPLKILFKKEEQELIFFSLLCFCFIVFYVYFIWTDRRKF